MVIIDILRHHSILMESMPFFWGGESEKRKAVSGGETLLEYVFDVIVVDGDAARKTGALVKAVYCQHSSIVGLAVRFQPAILSVRRAGHL